MAGVGILLEFDKASGYGKIETSNEHVSFHVKELVNGGEHDLAQWALITYELDAHGEAINVDLPDTRQYEGTVKQYDDTSRVGVIEMNEFSHGLNEVNFNFSDIFRRFPEQLQHQDVTFNLSRQDVGVASNVRFPNLRFFPSFGKIIKLKQLSRTGAYWITVQRFQQTPAGLQPDSEKPKLESHSAAVVNPELLAVGKMCTYVLRRMHDTSKQVGAMRADAIHISSGEMPVLSNSVITQQGLPSGPSAGYTRSVMSAGLESVATYTSLSSLVSAGFSGPKCFLKGSLLKMSSKTMGCVWVPVENIKSSQRVLSPDGQELVVKRATTHSPKQGNSIIQLSTSTVTMSFTDSHPVVTPDGSKLARELAQDDLVMITTLVTGVVTLLPQPLERVQRHPLDADVYELVFDPDMPVESFFEPAQKILSKGPGDDEITQRKSRSHHQRKRESDWKSTPYTSQRPRALSTNRRHHHQATEMACPTA